MKYYLKKCGAQELGSVGRDGRPTRGRYLHTSKRAEVLSLFPPLSKTKLNDFYPLPLVPLHLKEKSKVYCRFVYHNDKFNGSTSASPHDDYRLYLNLDVEGGRFLFKKDDILVFRQIVEDDPLSGMYVLHLPKGTGTFYRRCQGILRRSDITDHYAVYEGRLPEVERRIDRMLEFDYSVSIDETVMESVSNVSRSGYAKLFGDNQVMFRDFLLAGYEAKCAVTGQAIRHKDLINVEAAHIRPRAHRGSCMPNNGILLNRDLHWAFDKGFFTLTDSCEVLVHPKAKSGYLTAIAGKKLFRPSVPFFRPALENIRWHRKHLFGMFLRQGVIQRG